MNRYLISPFVFAIFVLATQLVTPSTFAQSEVSQSELPQSEAIDREATNGTVTVVRTKSSLQEIQKDKSDAQNAAILREIKEIRDLMGGGVAKQLEGLYDDKPIIKQPNSSSETKPDTKADTGAGAKSALLAKSDRGSTLTLDLSGDHVQTEMQKMLRNAFEFEIKKLTEQVKNADEEPPANNRNSPMDSLLVDERLHVEEMERLRAAAKFLDLAASELEEVAVFEEADNLRQRAQALRLKARKVMR